MAAYYCVPATFEKAMPEMEIATYGKDFCAGSIKLQNHRTVQVVFRNETQTCPAPGTHIIGHLGTLCQDTGQWTKARYWFSSQPDFCSQSHETSLKKAQASANEIHSGMTRGDVRERLKDYAFIGGSFGEQYYLYPDVVLEVHFDETDGSYSQDNKVQGAAVVTETRLPQP